MKKLRRIISMAMILVLFIGILPMNLGVVRAEEVTEQTAKLLNMKVRVYDGNSWKEIPLDRPFNPSESSYLIKLDRVYNKIQLIIEKENDDDVVSAKYHTGNYNFDSNNYGEAKSITASTIYFNLYVSRKASSKRMQYIINNNSTLKHHEVRLDSGYRDYNDVYVGDTVTIKPMNGGPGKVFDQWSVISGNVNIDNPYRSINQFTMPDSDVHISALYKDAPGTSSKLNNIYVHALKDSVWRTFCVPINSEEYEYDYDLSSEYNKVYLTLQEEDKLLPPFDQSKHLNEHFDLHMNNKQINLSEYISRYDTEVAELQNGENIFKLSLTSLDGKSKSEYTLKVNRGEVKYKASFNPGEGKGSMDAKEIVKGSTYTLPECTFTAPENKEFAGWRIGNEDKKPGDTITVNGNIEVKAIWKDIQVKVSFNANQGTGTMRDVLVNKGSEYTLPTCDFTSPENKEFKAWSVNGEEKAIGDEITIDADTEVKAIWKDIQVKVSFNANQGTGTMKDVLVNKGSIYTLPTCDFTAPENKEFKAWEVAGEEKAVGDEITINADTEVKAIWKDKPLEKFKLIINANNGTDESIVKEIEKGSDFELPECTFTVPDAKVFKAWEIDGQEYPAKTNITINKETIIKAIWQDKPVERVKLIFEANNKTGETKELSVEKGKEYTLPQCEFTVPEGQEFKAWEVDGEEKAISEKILIDKETIVKAIWKEKTIEPQVPDEDEKYSIKLMPSPHGKVLLDKLEAKKGELITVKAVPNYGYALESIIILDENQNLVPMSANQFTMPIGAVSIYAKFRELAPAVYPETEEEKALENKRHRRDWHYDRYNEDKKANEVEEQVKEEKEIIVKESKAIITIGSQVLEKVDQGIHTFKTMDSAPYIKRGRTMLPLRYLAEALGYKVFWLNETKTVVITDLGLRVEIPIDTNLIIVNGIKYTSDIKPEIVNNRTMLPIANIARALGLKDGEDIIWDEVNRKVIINRKTFTK